MHDASESTSTGNPAATAPPGAAEIKGGRLHLPPSRLELEVRKCPVCGDSLADLGGSENCPSCGSPARTRSLAPVLSDVVSSLMPADDDRRRPLLAFAMTSAEHALLKRLFPAIKSVSLYGIYGADHEMGVDARDLSCYGDATFSGHFGILLFDYFAEHERALREAFRILIPGGVLFTHIARYRLNDSDDHPSVQGTIKSRPGYFEYLPPDTTLPSILVGRSWFVGSMRRAGFDADQVRVKDLSSGVILDWFIGQKPRTARNAVRVVRQESQVAPPASESVTQSSTVAAPIRITSILRTPTFSRTYSTPVDPAFGFRLVGLTLSLPQIPDAARDACFAEHPVDPVTGEATETVVALKAGGVLFSNDLGQTWEYRETPETGSVRLFNCFTLADGHRLVQTISPAVSTDQSDDRSSRADLFRFDRDWRLVNRSAPSVSHWHGKRSIDEREGTIIFAEYPDNATKYRPDFIERQVELVHLCENSRVFRSRDGGVSWEKVMELPWTEIRHFHTVASDPFAPGVWWLSSGDRSEECRVWRSEDDGLTWSDVTNRDLDFPTQPQFAGYRQSAFRYTDVVITPDALLWGSDDWLGEVGAPEEGATLATRGGARLFVAPRSLPLRPTPVAYIGNPVRSIIDVGPCYLVTTEAKYGPILPRPQVLIVSKSDPSLCAEIGTIDRFATSGTGFTYSRASHIAKNGRFFSFRGSYDVFRGGPRILQWDITFQ